MGLLDLVFPKTCLGCGKEGSYICSECLGKVRIAQPMCPYCERASIDGVTHVKCLPKRGIDGLVSIWEYEGIIRKAILALKYKYSTEVGSELSKLFLQLLHDSKFVIPNSAVLIPVPLHWHKENVRGFNQSIEVGKAVAGLMGWKFIPDLLVKNIPTASQAELSGDARRKNLHGVFSLNPSYSLLDFSSKLCIVFDDVCTTGSTLREAAKVLKRAGVEKVWGLTIAR